MSKVEHGTTLSYVIGFILSLVFTFIPYHMVVNQTVSGSRLLLAILAIAVLQMLVQIIFFLHLGRGPKPLYNIVFFVSTVGVILIVVGGSIWIMNHLQYNMTPTDVSKYLVEKEGIHQLDGEETGACKGQHKTHKVVISNGKVSPSHTDAKFCDKLTFINEDDKVREIGFGSHPIHDGYAGQDDLLVYKGRARTIILNEPGTYDFHDHLEPNITGSFTVINDD